MLKGQICASNHQWIPNFPSKERLLDWLVNAMLFTTTHPSLAPQTCSPACHRAVLRWRPMCSAGTFESGWPSSLLWHRPHADAFPSSGPARRALCFAMSGSQAGWILGRSVSQGEWSKEAWSYHFSSLKLMQIWNYSVRFWVKLWNWNYVFKLCV